MALAIAWGVKRVWLLGVAVLILAAGCAGLGG